MKIIEASAIGHQVMENKQPLILGISINNSYFKEENLERLIAWASNGGRKVYVMIPDQPAIHTMVALGKGRADAERISRLKSNNLENKCLAIGARLGVTAIKIIRWKDLSENAEYGSSLEEIINAYKTDAPFTQAVRETTEGVLANGGYVSPSPDQVAEGVQFLLKELAFITYADLILKEPAVAYVYHRTMPSMREIMEGRYNFRSSPNVGFVTAE